MSLTPAFKIGLCNAWIFMIVFLLQMLAIIVVNRRAWERSHIPVDARRSKFERYVGIVGNLVWLLAMGYSVFLPLQPDTAWFSIGMFIFVVGLTLMATATYDFITTLTNRLITTGAYRCSRHPMYLASFFICLGAGLAALSWLFIFLSIVLAFCFYQEALIEERYCLNKYGDSYQEYKSKTPRLIGVPKKADK
jgi:protein-S-isoprenylcysteine O-methyltransferase Ste14